LEWDSFGRGRKILKLIIGERVGINAGRHGEIASRYELTEI